jgi:predicted ATPase
LEPDRQHYVLLAHHYKKAENKQKAAEYYALAGTQALLDCAYVEAIGFLQRCLQLRDREQIEETVSTRRKLGQAYYGLHN